MSTKHTPGPWITETKGDTGEYWNTVHAATPDGMVPVAEAHFACDARLIAAAPELLEALKDIIAAWDTAKKRVDGFARMTHSAEFWDHIAQARAAIAKAEGK